MVVVTGGEARGGAEKKQTSKYAVDDMGGVCQTRQTGGTPIRQC